MKRPTPRQVVTFLLGPWMIIPSGFAWAMLSLLIYGDPPEMHGHLERALFLQGNTDLGGGCLFAATAGLYVAFGFTAAWYLVLKLENAAPPRHLFHTLARSAWILKFHVLAFIVGGTANFGYDARVTPNDFRNVFLFAGLIYTFSVLLIAALHTSHIPACARYALAPLFIVLWLMVGSDGNTARAGQLVQSGQDPQPVTRSVRHAIMLSWHRLCDATLGDI